MLAFAAGKLDAVLRDRGGSPVHRAGGTAADIAVSYSDTTERGAGNYEIRKRRSGIAVTAVDESGAMYGIVGLAEQIRAAGLARVKREIVLEGKVIPAR